MKRMAQASFTVVVTLVAGVVAGSPARAELRPPAPAMNLAAISDTSLLLPHDMTLTPDGQYLVVADMGNNRVVLLDPSTLALRHIIGAVTMSFPHDVAFDPLDRLLVADSGNDRILVYSLSGTEVHQVGEWTGLDSVEGITATPDGRIYATLAAEHRVVQLRDGKIVASIDSALGLTLDRPHDIEAVFNQDGLHLFVADSGNHRLIVLDGALNPLYEISTWDPAFSEPKYLSVNEQGLLYVADPYNNRVRVFNAQSAPLGYFAQDDVKLPEGVLAKNGRVWISDTERGRILLYQQVENNYDKP